MLEGKRLLITGVLTDDSIAWHTARVAQEQGAEIVLTGADRGLRLTRRTAKKLPVEPEVLEFDAALVSTGSRPRIPDWCEPDGDRILTTRDCYPPKVFPESMVMLRILAPSICTPLPGVRSSHSSRNTGIS